jgi:molybdopterin/thiamine biosynthesis adenylyltransferase
MEDKYFLNPFATVAEVGDAFLIGTSNPLQARFEKKDKAIIDFLISENPLQASDVARYLARSRVEELQRKRILLREQPPSLQGRYSRQFGFFSLLSEDFRTYQSLLESADVLLLGAGAIGSHVLWNLAAMGTARITVVDFDVVDETNLNRQLMYSSEDIGEIKVDVLCSKIADFNPTVRVTPVNRKISSPADIDCLAAGKTLVIKAIDTPEQSTEWVNQVCVKRGIPFIVGGFLDYLGVVGPVYIPGRSLCAACIEPGSARRIQGTSPSFAPLTTIVSGMVSMAAFKIITGLGHTVANKLYVYNLATDGWQTMPLTPTQPCKVCGQEPRKEVKRAHRKISPIWWYRGSIVFFMLLGFSFRTFLHERYAGVFVFIVLLFSIPVLEIICARKPEETRRQIFAISCIYGLLSFLMSVAQNPGAFVSWPIRTFDGLFSLMQGLCVGVIEAVIAITFLFFALNLAMLILKAAIIERGAWIS